MDAGDTLDPKEGYRLEVSNHAEIKVADCIADRFERTIGIMIGREDYDENEGILKALGDAAVSINKKEYGIPHFAGGHALIETYVFKDGSFLIVARQKKPYLPQYPKMFVFTSRNVDNDGISPVITVAKF